MKALSIKQPWANMIARRDKTIELRMWGTPHRGPLLICSSKKPYIEPAGYAIAIVDMIDCRRAIKEDEKAACSVIWEGRDFAWIFENVRKINPFKVKGEVGIFDVDYGEPLR